MSYSFDSCIRLSEIGEDRKLTLNSIINYFQDCSTFHSQTVDLGLEALEARNRAWILSSWQVCINRCPKMGEAVTVSTWPYNFKGFYGYRNFVLKSFDSEILAYANSIWIFMDITTGKPVRVGEKDVAGYQLEEKLEMDYAPRKVIVPKEGVQMEPFRVKHYHLDLYHHVNNGQYIQMAKEYLPVGFSVCQMRAEYRIQAVLGDVVVPRMHNEDGIYTVTLCNEEGQQYAIVEFQ